MAAAGDKTRVKWLRPLLAILEVSWYVKMIWHCEQMNRQRAAVADGLAAVSVASAYQ